MDEHRLRPHSYLLRRGVSAALAFLVPATAVLYFITVPEGPWIVVLVGEIMVLALLGLAIYRYQKVGVWVSPTSITEQGFFGRSHYEKNDLGSIVFVNTFHGGWVDTVPQLFVCDREGTQLLRLRGQFWSQETMRGVAATLDLPLTEIDAEVSTAELHEQYPGLLYWFERRPVLAASLFATTLIVGGIVLYLVLVALGVTASGA